jgi:hypothetical protein
MEIKTRRLPSGLHSEVQIIDGQTTLNLGLFNEEERFQLATTLCQAADQLTDIKEIQCVKDAYENSK